MGKVRYALIAGLLACAALLIAGCAPVVAPAATATPEPSATPGDEIAMPVHLKTISELSYSPNGSMQFGYGFDSITGMPKDSGESAIAYANVEQAAGLTQGSVNAYFVETKEDVYKAMDISASASYKGLAWSGDAKFNYANSLALKSDCVNFIIRGRIFGHTYRISGESLKPELVARGLSKEDFYAYYGDKYLYEMVTGAEYYAYVQVACRSRDQKTKIEASVSGSAFGGSVDTSLASELTSYVSSNEISVSVTTFGGPPAGATDLPTMVSEVNAFLKQAYAEPSAWQTGAIVARYKSYWQLQDYPKIDVTPYKSAYAEALKKYSQDAFIYNSFLSDTDLNDDSVADMSEENLAKRSKLASDIASLGAALDAASLDGFRASCPSGLNYPDTPAGIDLTLNFVELGKNTKAFQIPNSIVVRADTYTLYRLEGGFIPADIYEYFYLADKYPFIANTTNPQPSTAFFFVIEQVFFLSCYLTANGTCAQAYLTQTTPNLLYTFPSPYDYNAETVTISGQGVDPTDFYPSLTNYGGD